MQSLSRTRERLVERLTRNKVKNLSKEQRHEAKVTTLVWRSIRVSVSLRPILGDTEEKAWKRACSINSGVRTSRRCDLPKAASALRYRLHHDVITLVRAQVQLR